MKKPLIIGGVVLVVIAIIAVSAMNFDSTGTMTNNANTPLTASSLSFSNLVTDDTPLKGDPSAPITLVEFSDFQCPNCARFAKEVSPQIEATYVESGMVSIAYKHFTIVGPDSKPAAMASQCAKEQGMFWEYHDEVFSNQGKGNTGWASRDNMKLFALNVGLDMPSFNSCFDSNKYKSLVEDDLLLSKKLEFTGTPSFLVLKNDGSKPIVLSGAYPFATFQKIFDDYLNK